MSDEERGLKALKAATPGTWSAELVPVAALEPILAELFRKEEILCVLARKQDSDTQCAVLAIMPTNKRTLDLEDIGNALRMQLAGDLISFPPTENPAQHNLFQEDPS